MKIAVASIDGKNVDLHFGKAKRLYIYKYEDEKLELLEKREVTIIPDKKHQWKETLNTIKDCDVIICQQAGMNGKYGIEKEGLKLVENTGLVEDCLNDYIKHHEFMNKPLNF